LPGLQATAAASGRVSALLYLPLAAILLAAGAAHLGPLDLCRGSRSVELGVPFALDLTALRTVPARYFGIFISAHPVLAVLAGVVTLHQVPAAHEVLGIGIVVCTNIIAVSTMNSTRTSTRTRSTP
jgi:inner membrane transporter RhtA